MQHTDEQDHHLHFKAIARKLTIVENDLAGVEELLTGLNIDYSVPVIGITGSPGAGKSTLVNALIAEFLKEDKKIAILAIDPTSPFNFGSLLGDRIRMASHFNHPGVFIRSVGTRGSVGGLSLKTIEMTDVLRSSGFDYVFVETVGVGQSEIDIAGLADITVVVLIPEGGDEIQHIKSGLMEIADVFVINKADREGADNFANSVKKLTRSNHLDIPVFKTVAQDGIGIGEVAGFLRDAPFKENERKDYLLTEKVYRLIQKHRMADIDKQKLRQIVTGAAAFKDFNVYRFAWQYINGGS